MVGGVAFYGHRIAQEMGRMARERELHVEELRLNEQRLRQQMRASQQQQTQEITDVTSVLTDAFSQITTSLSQILASSSETASAVTETATTMEEVKQTASVVSHKAQSVADTAVVTAQVAQTGEQAVAKTREGLEQIRTQMTAIAERVLRLDQQSHAIGDIITTVNDFAEQSNLLAINAAIEAAKAGEHGKGFSVVALEVRTLAEQSKHATMQIRSILHEIQRAAQEAVVVTEQGSLAVEFGLRQSLEADESIQALTHSMMEAVQAVRQIAVSSEQQLVGMDQVASAMSSMKKATGQHVNGMRQIEFAAHNLQNVGSTLHHLVQQLRQANLPEVRPTAISH